MTSFLLTAILLSITAGSNPLPYDGLIRPSLDGSSIAYMNPLTGPSNHASFLEQFPSEAPFELGLVWFSGAKEEANKCAIVYSRLPRGSQQWTNASVISVRNNYSNQNPVLFFDTLSDTLHCFHSSAPAESGESQSQIWHLQSTDYGVSWTAPKPLFTFPGAFPRNRIIAAVSPNTKGVLFPIYNAANSTPLIAKSADRDLGNAASWTLHPMADAAKLVQPSVVRLPNASSSNSLKAFLRDRNERYIYVSSSEDDGVSWSSPVPLGLPNPNVAIQANVLTSGAIGGGSGGVTLVLLFNDYNGHNQLGRTPMSLAVSYDDGETWPNVRALQVHDDDATRIPMNGGLEYSYPSVLQTDADALIHVSYTYDRETIKYLRFNLTWALIG